MVSDDGFGFVFWNCPIDIQVMYFVGMLMYFVLTGFPNILGN